MISGIERLRVLAKGQLLHEGIRATITEALKEFDTVVKERDVARAARNMTASACAAAGEDLLKTAAARDEFRNASGALAKKVVRLEAVLRKAEWGGTETEEPYCASCPVCGGLKPDPTDPIWNQQTVGHRPGCELAQVLA